MHLLHTLRTQVRLVGLLGKILFFILFLFSSFLGKAQNTLDVLGLTNAHPASVAFSVRKLSTAYSGPVMRVRRASDDAIGDVAFDSNNEFGTTSVVTITNVGTPGYSLGSTVSLATFSATTDVYVTTWYDQSGNANNLVENNALNQPKIVVGGALQTENGRPFVRFYGVTSGAFNQLVLTNSLSTNAQVIVVNKFIAGGNGFLLGNANDYFWHSDVAGGKLFVNYASSSVYNGTIFQNGVSKSNTTAVWNTSLSINSVAPQTANSNTTWDNIGRDRTYHHTTSGGGYAEILSFPSTMISLARTTIESNESSYFSIASRIVNADGFTTCTDIDLRSFTIQGYNLTGQIEITPPAGYQVSLNSSSGFTSSISLTPASGTVPLTRIYVKKTSGGGGSVSITNSDLGSEILDLLAATPANPIEVLPSSNRTAETFGTRSMLLTHGVSIHPTTGEIYTVSSFDRMIYRLNTAGIRSSFASPSFSMGSSNFYQLTAFDSAGNLYVSDYLGGRVYKYSSSGTESIFASGLNTPTGLAFDANDNLYVASFSGDVVYKITPAGISSTLTTVTSASRLIGLAVGPDGFLYAAANSASRIFKINLTNGSNTIFASVFAPIGLVFDAEGNLLVSSSSQISKITPAGILSTFISSSFSPTGLALASNGTLYIGSRSSRFFRSLPPITTICTSGTMALNVSSISGIANDWYTSTGSLLASNVNSYTTPSLTQPTAYFVQARNNTTGCLSASRTQVIASVNGLESSTGAVICEGATATLSAVGKTGTVNWYTDNSSSSAIVTGTSYTTPALSTTTRYYADAANSFCPSGSRTAVDVTVNPSPTISLASIPSLGNTATSFTIPFTAAVGSPNQFSLTTGTRAMAGFTSVNNQAFVTSPLSVSIPASPNNTYDFNLTLRNSTTGCSSTAATALNLVVQDPAPTALSYATPNVFSKDIAITPLAPTYIGVVTGFSVSPSLPVGLSINASTGVISGIPTAITASNTYVVSASNATGAITANVRIEIVAGDTDGDGVPDSQELIDNTNQFEPCDYKPASQMRSNVSADWLAWDCDGDGRPNGVDINPLNYAIGGVPGFIPVIGTRAYTNFFALADNDNDGIPNSMECFGTSAKCADFDGDGLANYVDTDSDGDGLLDSTERNVDTDGDGDANYLDLDTDNDGILDRTELLYDTDNDGIPNLRDLDSDGDGIPDTNEATENFRRGVDLNTDGRLDDITDTNGNGLADHLERKPLGIPDTDKDGIPDYLDLDSDNDGLLDRIESGGDFDGDKIPDFRDMDSDNDWIADGIEGLLDSDKDGIPNYLDADSDGDGIVDSWEGANKCVSCTTLQDADNDGWDDRKQYAKDNTAIDTDKDGIPDFLDADSDNDTIEDRVELGADMDADDIPNFRDTDSDNDKILDIIETAVDTDKDGMADFEDLDSDNDTIPDAIETDVDTDKDGIRDFRDEDSDNDKILDKNEKAIDTDGDGKFNFQDTDSDGDGIPDAIETEVDTDKDGKQDYVDTESDGDGIPDAVEAGANPEKPVDTDKDGTANYLDLDSDNDGITDQSEAGKTPESPLDTDADGTPDYLDLDSDNDKIDDKTETNVDTDKDGKPNYIDTDSDNDGILDLVETTIDTDKDGIPNYLDPDSDGDGIADKFEGTKDSDNDGRPDYLDLDSDNDGYSDADERGITSLDQAPLDTDKDGLADYIDTDSDGDGILDKLEDDINLGNLPDCDKDGISNRLDKDICDLLKPRGISPNGDGKNDFLIIPGILRFEPNHLMIYNRWGTLVYETNNYQNKWAGTDNKGVELPDGVYYYLIDFFGKRPEISTYVYVNRAD